MHKTIASAVCGIAFMAGDLCAQSHAPYPNPIQVKDQVIVGPNRNGTYGHLECFSGGSKVECDSAMSGGTNGDIRWLLEGMAKLLGTVQPRR